LCEDVLCSPGKAYKSSGHYTETDFYERVMDYGFIGGLCLVAVAVVLLTKGWSGLGDAIATALFLALILSPLRILVVLPILCVLVYVTVVRKR
jgi:hypothetical protein